MDVLKKALFRTERSPAEESTYACKKNCMHKWILPRDYFRSEIVPSLGRLFLEKLAIFSEKPAIFVEVDNFPATKPAIFAEKSCDFWEKTSGHPGCFDRLVNK